MLSQLEKKRKKKKNLRYVNVCLRRFIYCRVNGDAARSYTCEGVCVCVGCVCVCVCVCKGQRDTVLHITALQMAVVSGCDSESE